MGQMRNTTRGELGSILEQAANTVQDRGFEPNKKDTPTNTAKKNAKKGKS